MQGCFQGGQILVHGEPDHGEVHAQIVVDQFVAHAGDVGPGNLAMLGAEFSRNLFDGFPEDFQLPDGGILDLPIFWERFSVVPVGVLPDLAQGIQHVPEIDPVIFRHAEESVAGEWVGGGRG